MLNKPVAVWYIGITMYPFRIRCFQIIKCTRFNGDSVDREYLSVYQILHIEIMR